MEPNESISRKTDLKPIQNMACNSNLMKLNEKKSKEWARTHSRKFDFCRYLYSFDVYVKSLTRYWIKISSDDKKRAVLCIQYGRFWFHAVNKKSQFHLTVCDINWIKNFKNWAIMDVCWLTTVDTWCACDCSRRICIYAKFNEESFCLNKDCVSALGMCVWLWRFVESWHIQPAISHCNAWIHHLTFHSMCH